MAYLVLVRVGVPTGTSASFVWDTLRAPSALAEMDHPRLYQPTRGFFEPTEWLLAGEMAASPEALELPGDKLPLRKVDVYPFRGEVNPYGQALLESSMPVQLVTITVVPPRIEAFEQWYAEHADVLSRAVGATGARRYWQDGSPRRYASLYFYASEEGIERYLVSEIRKSASDSRLPFDPWLVDQHHAFYKDVTPVP